MSSQFNRAHGTIKQRAFVRALFDVNNPRTFGNGTQSARKARYKGNDVTLAAVAYENLRKPQVTIMAEQFVNKVLSTEQIENELVEVAQSRVIITESSKMKALDLLTKIKGMVTQRVETVDVTERSATEAALIAHITNTAKASGTSELAAARQLFARMADHPTLSNPANWPVQYREALVAPPETAVIEGGNQ